MIKSLNEELFDFFSSGGRITDIGQISDLLKEVPLFFDINLNEHFWDLFVTDAFIANSDRNLGNIGIILGLNNKHRCSPVYDNGSSFNCRMTEDMIKKMFKNWKSQHKSVFLNLSCPYKFEEKNISPLTYIYKIPCDDCIEAIGRVVPRINLAECIKPILELKNAKLISKTQAAFYVASLSVRYKKRLLPVYEQYFGPIEKENELLSLK